MNGGADGHAVEISVDDPAWRGAVSEVERLCRDVALEALAAAAPELTRTEISLVLTGDGEMARLNETYRSKPGPTNVLSFPCGWRAGETPGDGAAPALLGDVVLAHGVARAEAEAAGKPLADHLRHLVAHGVLHLLGHDHETDADARRMEALEAAVLRRFGVENPYGAEQQLVT